MAWLAPALARFDTLTHLNVSDCGAAKSGMTTLLKALESKPCANLEVINLSGNKLDADGSMALAGVLARTPKIRELYLVGTSLVFGAFPNQKLENLQKIQIGGNKMQKDLDVIRFIQNAPNLLSLDMSRSSLPVEVIRLLTPNVAPKLTTLNVSENELGDMGVAELCRVLISRTELKTLNMGKTFYKRTKERIKAVRGLMKLFEDPNCNIQSLDITGSSNSTLKTDILPFLVSLMNNKKIKELKISANEIGNILGLVLGKMLQVNRTLEALYIDGNKLNYRGFKMFKLGLDKNITLVCVPYPVLDANEAHAKFGLDPKVHKVLFKIQEKLLQNLRFRQAITYPVSGGATPFTPRRDGVLPNAKSSPQGGSSNYVSLPSSPSAPSIHEYPVTSGTNYASSNLISSSKENYSSTSLVSNYTPMNVGRENTSGSNLTNSNSKERSNNLTPSNSSLYPNTNYASASNVKDAQKLYPPHIDVVKANALFGEMDSFLEMYNDTHTEDKEIGTLKLVFDKYKRRQKK